MNDPRRAEVEQEQNRADREQRRADELAARVQELAQANTRLSNERATLDSCERAVRGERDKLLVENTRLCGWLAMLIVDPDRCPSCGGVLVYSHEGNQLHRAGFAHRFTAPGCALAPAMGRAADAAASDKTDFGQLPAEGGEVPR